MPRCICQCQRETKEQRKAAEERQRRMERIKRRKPLGLQDRYLYDYTFASNSGQNSLMNKAHVYVENCCRIPLAAMGNANANNFFVRGRKTYPHLRLPIRISILHRINFRLKHDFGASTV